MSQYINLYNPALRKRRDPLSARVLLSAAIAAIVVMALEAGWVRYQITGLERQAKEGEARLKSERENLVSMAKSLAERKSDPKLAEDLARAEAVLKTRGDLVRLLESGTLGKTEGFSAHLRAFSRQSMNGLWLTGFSVGAGGDLEIKGKALTADLLPAYIRKLNGERVFYGQSFAMLTVHGVQPEAAPRPAGAEQLPPHVTFNLSGSMQNADLARQE